RQLEEIVAGPAIARAYLEHRGSAEVDGTGARRVPLGSGSSLGVSESVDARQVFDLARQGDPVAPAVVRRVADALAWAIASATAVLDLSLVVLGGGVGLNADLLLGPVRSRVAELVPFAPEIRISSLGGDATLFGAIAVALRQGRTLAQQREAVASGKPAVLEVGVQ
ncbi:MAG: ROK family protein, partial [Bacillota bacterium]